MPSVNSSGDESVSEDSEYVPVDNEISSEADEISDDSEDISESASSDASDEENVIRKIKKNVAQKFTPKHEIQNTPKKTRRGRKAVVYKDYVSCD